MALLFASFLFWVVVPPAKIRVTLKPNGTLQLDSKNFETETEFLQAFKGRIFRNQQLRRPVAVQVLVPSSAWPHSLPLMFEVSNATDDFTFQQYDPETGEIVPLQRFSGEAIPDEDIPWPQF